MVGNLRENIDNDEIGDNYAKNSPETHIKQLLFNN